MGNWLIRNRGRLYLLTNAIVLLALLFGWSSSSAPFGLVVYVVLLFALCSLPMLLLEQINDRYALLAMFMGVYFLLFGALDLQALVTGTENPPILREGFLTLAQIAVLLGAVFTLAGYLWGVRLAATSARTSAASDWSNGEVLLVGLGCFVVGTAAMAYFSLFVVTENSGRANERGFAAMGPMLTFAVMLAQMIQPLGVVILSYGYAKSRSFLWLLLVAVVIILQLVLGFLTDTKGTALIGFLLVAVTTSLWDGRISKAWVIGMLVFATLMFPILQANRVVRYERGLNRAQALENIWVVVQTAFESREKVYETHGGERSQTFLERTSGEAALEILFDHVGIDKPFLHGSTLIALPYAFVPRWILPDKEDVEVGQLFNRTFLHGTTEDFTYISVSVLGELYWNFGWPGVVIGSFLGGWLYGTIGARSSLADVRSLTRLLVLLVTLKALYLGYGGSISVSYVIWLRCMAAIGLLHLVFSHKLPTAAQTSAPVPAAAGVRLQLPRTDAPVRFPNLMR